MTSRWLRLIRIHTSSLTQPVVLLGVVLAGIRSWTLWFLYALFAVVYHAAGFLHNDISDYRHDKQDAAKAHFPLISGEVSSRQANVLLGIMTGITLFLGLGLSRGRWLSVIFLLTAVGFGWLYNFRCKKDAASPLYITTAFVSLPLFSCFAFRQHLSLLMIWTLCYMAFLMLFQIAVEGYMKDILTDKTSLLKILGTQIQNNNQIHVSVTTKLFSWGLKVPGLILFFIIWHKSESGIASLILGSMILIIIIGTVHALMKSGPFDNRRRVRFCAIIELFSYSLLIFALQGKLGWGMTGFFILYPVAWFILLNRLTWKTWITPRV